MSEENWLDGLESEELRIDPTLVRFKTLDEAAKSILEAKAYSGRSIGIPGEEADDAQWVSFDAKMKEKVPGMVRMPEAGNTEDLKRFWGGMGVPDKAEDYTKPKDFTGLEDGVIENTARMAFESGLTNTQFQAMLGQLKASATEIDEANQAAATESDEKIKKLWGAKYTDNISITDTLAMKMNAGKAVENMSNAERIRWMNAAEALSSDPQSFSQAAKVVPGRTPAELTQDISDMRAKLRDKTVTGSARKLLLARFEKKHEELAEHS